MQQAHTYHEVREEAWKASSMNITNNKLEECDMNCVSLCFNDFNYRFENIESVDTLCLTAECQCGYYGNYTNYDDETYYYYVDERTDY